MGNVEIGLRDRGSKVIVNEFKGSWIDVEDVGCARGGEVECWCGGVGDVDVFWREGGRSGHGGGGVGVGGDDR